MRTLVSLVLSWSLVSSQSAFALQSAEQQGVVKIVKVWSERKTVAQTLKAFESNIPLETFKFLSEKLAADKAEGQSVPKLIRRGPTSLTLESGGTMFSFGVKDLEKNEFLVNQKTVKILVNDVPEVIWEKVEKALNLSQRAGLFNLWVPRAEALPIAAGAIVLVVGALLYVANDYHCKKIELAMIDCETKIMDFTSGNYLFREHEPKRQIADARKVVKKLEGVQGNPLCKAAVSCHETTQDLKICIDKLVDQTKQTLKVDLRHLPKNVTADSEIDASEAME